MRRFLFLLLLLFFGITILALSLDEILALSKTPATLEESVDQLIAYILEHNPSYAEIASIGEVVYAKRRLREALPQDVFRAVCSQDLDAFLVELSRFGKKIEVGDPQLLRIVFPQMNDAVAKCMLSPSAECLTKLKNLALIADLQLQGLKLDASPSIEWALENALRVPLLFDETFGDFISAVFDDTWFDAFWKGFESKMRGLDEADYPKVELIDKHLHGRGTVVELIRQYMDLKLSVTSAVGKTMLGTEEEVRKVIAELPDTLKRYDELKTKKELLKGQILTLFDVLKKRIASVPDIESIRVEGLPSPINVSDPTLRREYYDILLRLSSGDSTEPQSRATESDRDRAIGSSVAPRWTWWLILVPGLLVTFAIPSVRYWLYVALGLKKLQMGLLLRRIHKDPINGELHLKLGEVYESLGMYEEAIREYSLAMRLMNERTRNEV